MTIRCDLCPKACLLKDGQRGDCRMRANIDGKLLALTYGKPCAIHVDPIEKKPLFHFLPGSSILSIATAGCNLHCKNCQNWEISQTNPEDIPRGYDLPPEKVPLLAKKENVISVAYTYTEPVAYFEYALDSSIKCREAGLKNILVTAACVNPAPWKELCKFTDAANIDLKFMHDKLYREVCDGYLKPVLDNLVAAKKAGVHVEITNLLVPTLNDADKDIQKLCRWIVRNMGGETPLHFSRFFPRYKLKNLPPTPPETLVKARDIAVAEGLKHIYVGNILIKGSQDTLCPNPKCGEALIARRGYRIIHNKIKKGCCPECNHKIQGVWK